MRLLRTISTRRLLSLVGAVVIAVGGASAIAIAATSSGPVPARQPLASAVHTALGAPAVAGMFARVTFTDHLISASDIQGSDPLLNGGSGRLWVAPGQGMRLEVQSDNGDAELLVHNGSFWAYDPASHTVYQGTLPAPSSAAGHEASGSDAIPSLAQIQSAIAKLSGHATVSGAQPGDIGGRPTYSARVSPQAGGGLLGGVAVAWDAVRGVPLRLEVFARGDSSPVLALSASHVSYGPVDPSAFSIKPPADAKVVTVDLPTSGAKPQAAHQAPVTGAAAVAKQLSFPLDAPASLAGQPLTSVTLTGHSPKAGAAITYGHGLGAIEVLEYSAGATSKLPAPTSGGGDQPGLSLPSVSVNGASAQELPTALGTVLQFSRHGVSYTVLGSVTAATAQSAARGL